MSATAPTDAVDLPVADLERRLTGFALDRVIGWGIAAGVAYAARALAGTSAFTTALVFVGTVVVLGLVTAALLGTTGVTPGKAALGLRVVRAADGHPIGVGPALGRVLVLGVAGLPTLGLGAATLGWTAAMDPQGRRRGLHDRIGDAVVVDVRPRPAAAEEVEERPQQLVNLTAMRLLPDPPASDATPTPAPAPVAAPAPPPAPAFAPPSGPVALPPGATIPSPAPAPAPTPAPASTGGNHRADGPAVTPSPTHVPGTDASAARWQVAFDTGESFEVAGLALVGRRPEPRPGEPVRHVVPLRSGDMSLSKTHAQFQVAPDGALVVMDRGSTNGSYVVRRGHSRQLAPGRPSTLLDGDVVRFGDRTMKVSRLSG